MGTDLTHQDDDVVFIAGDDRVFRLTEVADLRDDPAETVVLFDGGAERIVREMCIRDRLATFSKDLIPALNTTFWYRWMISYMCCVSFMDKNTMGQRGNALKMSHLMTYDIFRYVAENLVFLAKCDKKNGNSSEPVSYTHLRPRRPARPGTGSRPPCHAPPGRAHIHRCSWTYSR